LSNPIYNHVATIYQKAKILGVALAIVLFAILMSPHAFAQDINVGDQCLTQNATVTQGKIKLICQSQNGSLAWRKGDWKTVSIQVNVRLPKKSQSESLSLWDMEQRCKARTIEQLREASFVKASVKRNSGNWNSKSDLVFKGFKTTMPVGLFSKKSDKLGEMCMWVSKLNVINFSSQELLAVSIGKFSKTYSYKQLGASNWKITSNF
jgi:hypothetical protein